MWGISPNLSVQQSFGEKPWQISLNKLIFFRVKCIEINWIDNKIFESHLKWMILIWTAINSQILNSFPSCLLAAGEALAKFSTCHPPSFDPRGKIIVPGNPLGLPDHRVFIQKLSKLIQRTHGWLPSLQVFSKDPIDFIIIYV